MQYITMYLDSTNKFELTYQCYNLLVLSKHIVMYSIKLLACQARHINEYKKLKTKVLNCCASIYHIYRPYN